MSREKGRRGETLAREFLERAGFAIAASNFHARQAEIDLVARQADALVFIEVKYRRSLACGHPLEAVTPAKVRRLEQAARRYLLRHPWPGAIRFDLLAILELPGQAPVFEHVPDAVAF